MGEQNKAGSIRLTQYPFTDDIIEIQSHFKAISCLKVSFDDNHIFSASEDGSLVVYENRDKEFKVKLDKESIIETQFSEEFLITRDQYNKQKSEIDDLKFILYEEQKKLELFKKEKNRIKDDKIHELELLKNRLETQDANELNSIQIEKDELHRTYELKSIKKKEKNIYKLQVIQNEYKKKINLQM